MVGFGWAAVPSYVVLQDSDHDSLIRLSVDGKKVSTIANGAGGVGLAVDAGGNYIVGAKSALLKVTPAGVVSTIANAPGDSEWTAAAVDDSNGSYIVVDGNQPILWRIS